MQIMGPSPQNAADTFNIYLTTNTSGISETFPRLIYHMSLCITFQFNSKPLPKMITSMCLHQIQNYISLL